MWFFKRSLPRADKAALKSFLENFHWGEGLSRTEAKQNLEMAVVEIVDSYNDHRSNGLLITRHGYVVTSYHCVEHEVPGKSIRLGDGQTFPITKIHGYDIESDVAVIKAAIPASAEPLRYRFSKRHDISRYFSIALLARHQTELKVKGGYIARPSLTTVNVNASPGKASNQVKLSMQVEPGDSGGVVTTIDSQIYGILSVGEMNGEEIGACTFWFEALKLISAMCS